jgi:hypothetical protein
MAGKKRFGRKSAAQDNFLEPLAPTDVTATDIGTGRSFNDGATTVSFSLPATSPAATSFTATATASGQTTRTATGSSSPLTITGLASAVTYTVTVTATNAVGTSPSSSSTTVTATTVPAQIAQPSASSNTANQDILSWSAPATGGKAISLYRWTSSDGKTGTTTNTTVTITQEGGTAQTYQVRAENANGNGVYSVNSNNITTVSPFFPPSFPFFPPFFPPSFPFFPPNFGPFFPPNFGPFFPPNFGPFFPPNFGPSFPSGFYVWSFSTNTRILMADGTYKIAASVQVDDELASVDIAEISTDDFDPLTWSSDSFTVLANTSTKVVAVGSKEVTQLVSINGDLYSTTHYILTKKDGLVQFKNSTEIDTTFEIWSKKIEDWVNVEIAELIDFVDNVYSFDTEPYNLFFTENALVYDVRPRLT